MSDIVIRALLNDYGLVCTALVICYCAVMHRSSSSNHLISFCPPSLECLLQVRTCPKPHIKLYPYNRKAKLQPTSYSSFSPLSAHSDPPPINPQSPYIKLNRNPTHRQKPPLPKPAPPQIPASQQKQVQMCTPAVAIRQHWNPKSKIPKKIQLAKPEPKKTKKKKFILTPQSPVH